MGKSYVWVGPCKFEVQEIQRLIIKDEPADGDIDWCAQAIKIDANQHPRAKWLVLWHEVIHAILFNAGKDEAFDESLIDTLAQGVGQVLIDNADMRDFVD